MATKLCTLLDCEKPCHIDDSGTVHDFCSYSHAMEHQRKTFIQKQGDKNVVKGLTHCLLPECNEITQPFKNYCSKSHADKGIERGLASSAEICILTKCTRPKYKDKNGVVHPYCGKTHAEEAKALGIFPTATCVDDQCVFEDCVRPKYKEGTKVHNYCSLDHATKDKANRQGVVVLTPQPQIDEFLKTFENKLNIVSIEENHHAKPGGTLYNKFKDKMMSLPNSYRKTCLAFHGTPTANIESICQNGYDPKKRSGQAYGPGEYFGATPDTSKGYCRGGKKMILNELLMGQNQTHHTQHGNIIVMKNCVHDLPRFIITFA